jgi:hypothetical protein
VAVGWLSGARGSGTSVYLRKGGRITFRLSCPDGRYRLQDFAGREIGVCGKIVESTGIAPLVEVESLEILRT